MPKGSSDLQIITFIDKQNFQHVRAEYRHIISAQQGSSPDASAQKREQREILTEEFSNFKNENNLNLPHSYRIYPAREGFSETLEFRKPWNTNGKLNSLDSFSINRSTQTRLPSKKNRFRTR